MLLPLSLILLTQSAFAAEPVAIRFPGSTPTSDFLRARPTTVFKPHSLEIFHHARWRSMNLEESELVEWEPQDVLGPDIEDLHTLAQLARMSANAYGVAGRRNWYEVDPAWNTSFPVGWEDPENGFRGHVFMSSDNSTVVLSIKGTTLPLRGTTSKQDRFNDNLLFSCCCARVDFSWVFRKVCDCYRNSWRCDNTCLTKALVEDSLFYSVGVNLINDLLFLYPTANVWLVGHSLGGALAALLGTTFGLPAVAFESPGDRLPAQRLHLPLPPVNGPLAQFIPAVTHVYHNSDPIPQGACTGISSVCAQGGYALETRCHLGKSIVFDTVNKLGWKVALRTHAIRDVITEVLEADGVEWEEGRSVPLAREEVDCVDCYKWEFGDFLEDTAPLSV
ncbi:alpha/beta-hydrolase [Mycena maculata]|uniref:triacylglycerol lipase n=1 Tax=Mycena maculata TaxID=230809 RepID=A0AAD7IEY5_9AGAR|nr:alpha/beta-hydrolase [Mycena maculata]